ncbi:n-acetylglucosamine-6-phosphate deacetylase-like [Lichtheimia corymbifera JMRC:FSU:9682]|uniref:N-acetylglucosamine-6-phosphate deacetylase n=1 Tax=Lichtheimia corymbifera JMRC:FSU:9682 TaxID=1263082 RepID=A0A068RJE2_9FUNG|nr:n-acetylglucosamine-6-phosphate deacetylase-like [Lichtheimia corymbifera JMRC:FSU:9682]
MSPVKDSSAPIYKIVNAKLLLNHELVEGSYLWFQNGKIIHPQNLFFDLHREADEIIDAKGMLVVPGFIDTQINGAYGIDFADYEETDEKLSKDIDTVAKGLLKYGCTAFCPTVVSSEPAVYSKVLPLLRPRKGTADGGAEILGAHVEGPFISPEKKGAHKISVLQDAKNGIEDFDKAYGPELKKGKDAVSIMTLAPELPGVTDAIPDLVARGITVALGHSACQIADAEKAVNQGANSITHLFNAMQTFHHRDPGLVGVLGAHDLPIPSKSKGHPLPSNTSPCRTKADPRPFYGLICDGVHVHPNSIRIAYYSHPRGAVLVTDALSAMGLPAGTYSLGGRDVAVDHNGAAYIKGTNTLAGSTLTMDACVRNFQCFTNCTTVEALEAATLHPAQMLGIADRKGTLNVGGDADLVFLDEDLKVKRVFVAGEEVKL